MHNHNDSQGHNSKMMWLMMLPCLLLLVFFVVTSGKGIGAVTENWQWIIAIAAMIGIHVYMMKFMHGHKGKPSFVDDEKES